MGMNTLFVISLLVDLLCVILIYFLLFYIKNTSCYFPFSNSLCTNTRNMLDISRRRNTMKTIDTLLTDFYANLIQIETKIHALFRNDFRRRNDFVIKYFMDWCWQQNVRPSIRLSEAVRAEHLS